MTHTAETIARLGLDRQLATVALAALPADQQQAIEARVLNDREYSDIAAELQCSEALVRYRVSRGLRALRIRLVGGR